MYGVPLALAKTDLAPFLLLSLPSFIFCLQSFFCKLNFRLLPEGRKEERRKPHENLMNQKSNKRGQISTNFSFLFHPRSLSECQTLYDGGELVADVRSCSKRAI